MATFDLDTAEDRFAWKMRVLRSFYGLTLKEMATLMNYKSPANITFLEKYPMHIKPTFHFLVKLQQLFGISIDWIIADTVYPYTESSLTDANYTLREKMESLDLPFIPLQYSKEATLQQLMKEILQDDCYTAISYVDQGVLTFLLRYFDMKLCQYYEECQKSKDAKSFLLVTDEGKLMDKKHPEYIPILYKINSILGKPRQVSVLDDRWDLEIYADVYYKE